MKMKIIESMRQKTKTGDYYWKVIIDTGMDEPQYKQIGILFPWANTQPPLKYIVKHIEDVFKRDNIIYDKIEI
jgi:hypothetical protein